MIGFSTADTSGLQACNPLAGNCVKDGAYSPLDLYSLKLFQSVWNPRMCQPEFMPQFPGTAAAMLESLSEDETCDRWIRTAPFFRSGS